MKKASRLTPTMTVEQFRNGYWYTSDLKVFARTIGIPRTSTLRKDELEALIEAFLKAGKIDIKRVRTTSRNGPRDLEKGLSLKLPIINYTNNHETDDFITREALKIAPALKYRSGVKYRLNRWREDQIASGKRITYGDLVNRYVELHQFEGSFEKIPHGRYINFLADYLKNEEKATRQQAIEAWKRLKSMDIPKDYRSWKKDSMQSGKRR